MSGERLDLRGIVDRNVPLGIAGAEALLDFADTLLGPDPAALERARARLVETLGEDALTAAAAIAANFSRNDRIANATGIALEPMFVEQGADFIAALGLDRFHSARNSLRAR